MTDNTAEQLRARDLFEDAVKKWPNYSERTLVRDGRYPDYYGNPVVQGAWEGFKLGLRARADSGEAVAWMVTRDRDPTFPRSYTEKERAIACVDMVTLPPFAKIVELFTHPSTTAVDADCQLLPKGWRIEVRDNGRTKGLCVFSPDGCFAVDGNTDHKSDIRQHVIDLLGVAIASREDE